MAGRHIPALVIGALHSSFMSSTGVRQAARFAAVAAIGLTVANCANQPQQRSSSGSREIGAFSDSRKYGKASPRVVADGETVPKGGGRYHVGNAYRVAGKTYVPSERPVGHSQAGLASWYGEAFHGRKTANGEVYDRRSYTAAHPTMPLPSYARVTNIRNGNSIIVRVNDRGPFHGGRVMDVSERVANALNFKGEGTTRVRIDYLGKAGLAGSDDVKLAASLRTDGQPAVSPIGPGATTMVASAEPFGRPAASLRPNTPPAQPAAFASRPAPNATPIPSEPDDEVAETPAAPAAAPAAARALAYQPTPVRGIPAPPNRPFDLGTIPGASSPVRPGSLSFAPQTGQLSTFQKGNPLATLPSATFTPPKGKTIKTALAR